MADSDWPHVSVLLPTRDRPELLRAALRAIRDQEYPGRLDAIVVFDHTEPDATLVEDLAPLPVTVLTNDRTQGLCGTRNTAILAATSELVAFCDDDDEWLPGKLVAQVEALRAAPEAEFASTGITVVFQDSATDRLAGRDRITYPELLRSRLAMLHSSTFLARRSALVEGIGLLDETIPGSMCEDWDILLRAAARHPIVHVDQPLVRVLWGQTSFFSRRWETKLAAHEWMLEHHPDLWTSKVGVGRLLGQIAFDQAALGRRKDAVRTAGKSLRQNPREPRGVLAVAVASGAVSAPKVLEVLHKRGRGI